MSKHYMLVKSFYDSGRWTKAMVKNAVGRWITEREYKKIIGQELGEGDEGENQRD